MGRHPFPITLTQNPKRGPKVDRDPVISASLGAPSSTSCRSPKIGQNDQGYPKLGQGPTGPQHSPVTRPESLWSVQFCFESLELGSSCFDLLFCCGLLLGEFQDHCVIYWSFQALFCSDDDLLKLCSLAFDLGK
jgi:hypothetical protein